MADGAAPRPYSLPCNALGCPGRRAPELPLCRVHWNALPAELRFDVTRHYVFGQSVDPALRRHPWSFHAGRAVAWAMGGERERPSARRDGGGRGGGRTAAGGGA
jgi:hypothetical protein